MVSTRLINGQLRETVLELLKKQGRDFTHCEQCGDFIPDGKFVLHHQKYDGATLKDIQIVDAKCNQAPRNRHLK